MSKKDFSPEVVVVNDKIQRFNVTNGKTYWKVELWFEAEEKEHPETWQWDALLSPQRARLESINALEHKELVRSGFVDPTAGPKCATCFDLTFVLETISEQDLGLVFAYYNYASAAWTIRNCPDCSADQDVYKAEQRACAVYQNSEAAQQATYNDNQPRYRVLYRPDPLTYRVHSWDRLERQSTMPALLIAGKDGCYADHKGDEHRDRNRRKWAEKWKVTEVLETFQPKPIRRKTSFGEYTIKGF